MLGDPKDPNSLSTRLRKRRDVVLRELITSIADTMGAIHILDVGGTLYYWERLGIEFLRHAGAKITLLNLHNSEIADLAGVEDIFERSLGNGCELSQYDDNAFDLVHSNSVIEHVITWANMRSFAQETRRVGRAYYVQTPYFWFPIDPHFYRVPFFHWMPRPTRAALLRQFPIAYSGRIREVDAAYATIDGARLLDRRQFSFLFPDAELTFERFAGLKKSMVAIRRT